MSNIASSDISFFARRPRSINDSLNVPFYIFAPDYRNNSGGIRVLHYLCHILNELGEEAYVVNCQNISPRLRTPQLTLSKLKEHYLAGQQPVTIYPEVMSGNPLNTPLVVRWLLNVPGHLGKPIEFELKDLIFYYEAWCMPPDLQGTPLFIHPVDHSIFNNDNNPDDHNRTHECFYANKYFIQDKPILKEHRNLLSLGQEIRRTPEEIAAILRKSKVLYCYEQSGLISEAQACGCPVLFVRSDYWALPQHDTHHRIPGAAVYQEENSLERALQTLPLIPSVHAKARDNSWVMTKVLVEAVNTALEEMQTNGKPLLNELQSLWAMNKRDRAEHLEEFSNLYLSSGLNFKDVDSNSQALLRTSANQYQTFLDRISLQEIDGQLLAERMIKSWTRRPIFNIMIEARSGEENLLADSIDSIAAQWYPEWHLTIVSEFMPADPSLASLDQITWVVRKNTEAISPIMDETIAGTPGDWLFLMEPGNLIEPHALAYFADTINLQPSTRLIYCDEDVINAKGKNASPRFKPDANLELLRSMYYLGPALAIERQALINAGGWGAHPLSAYYDIALRILDLHGRDAFTHQRDMLLHTPELSMRSIDEDSEIAAVRDHLERNGIEADIEAGLLSGTQKISYKTQQTPLVSIIIPTRDQPGYLSHCIDSLLANTDYPNWELIIVDHATRDPDALNYIDQLDSRPELVGRLKCTRTDVPFNYAHLCNLGTEEAQGEILLFLDNDTQLIQASWLNLLVGQIMQAKVGAISPRLSKPDANLAILLSGPRLLGLGGLANGMAGPTTNILEPGYCGRLQVAQDTSALNGSCFMVKRKLFDELNGFNEVDTPLFETVLDFCLRLGKIGQRMIWTPWVDVVHHGGVTRNRLEADQTQRVRLTELVLQEQNHLYANYLHQLADDPYYHRHLSLQLPFAAEANAVIDWDTRFHDRLHILGQPLSGGSGEYRMLSPFRALQKTGLAQTCHVHLIGPRTQRVLTPTELARAAPDVLMLQQAIDDVQIAQLKRYRQLTPEIFITYSVDDVLGNLPRKHYLYNFQAREGKSRMREGLALCNRLIASTTPIADYCSDMIDDIVIVPNRLDGNHWLHLQSKRGTSKKPRVGWAGAQQHLGDLEMIKEVVEALHDEVDWIFMGMCPDFLKPFVAEEHPFVPWQDYPAKLASLNLDLAIAPLEQHFFNEGKSNLRLLEYGIMGWPVVCTDIYPYQTNAAPVKRVNNIASEWITAIRERTNDLDAAYREGDTLREWVLKHYIIEGHASEWLKALTPGKG